jgi:hypothetical protein
VITRRGFVVAAGTVLLVGMPGAYAQAMPKVVVYKNPSCGCCGEWVKHMRANGFRVETREVADVSLIRRDNAVPDFLASCHTLLRERPAVKGLAVPGMVAGSPGMEQGPPQRYATIAFNGRDTRIFERH